MYPTVTVAWSISLWSVTKQMKNEWRMVADDDDRSDIADDDDGRWLVGSESRLGTRKVLSLSWTISPNFTIICSRYGRSALSGPS